MAEYIVKPYNNDDEETIIREWHPEELIRCKDCRTSTLTKRVNGEFLRNCPVLCMDVSDDFYCANGRPKDGE